MSGGASTAGPMASGPACEADSAVREPEPVAVTVWGRCRPWFHESDEPSVRPVQRGGTSEGRGLHSGCWGRSCAGLRRAVSARDTDLGNLAE